MFGKLINYVAFTSWKPEEYLPKNFAVVHSKINHDHWDSPVKEKD